MPPRLCAPQAKYGMDEVRYVDELAAVLAELAPPSLHVLSGAVNSDSGLAVAPLVFDGSEAFTFETGALHPVGVAGQAQRFGRRRGGRCLPARLLIPAALQALLDLPNSALPAHPTALHRARPPCLRTTPAQVLAECRVCKSDAELRIMRYACETASAAHVMVMQAGGAGRADAPALPGPVHPPRSWLTLSCCALCRAGAKTHTPQNPSHLAHTLPPLVPPVLRPAAGLQAGRVGV